MNPSASTISENPRRDGEIALQLAVLRLPLRGYIRSLVPDDAACEDLVQETLLFMWERRDMMEAAENPRAWAFKIAWFKVMAWRRDRKRDRLVYFSDEVLQQVAATTEPLCHAAEARLEALRLCLTKLPKEELALLRLKYIDHGSLTQHAEQQGWKPNRVQKTLSRLRLALRHCIQSRLRLPS